MFHRTFLLLENGKVWRRGAAALSCILTGQVGVAILSRQHYPMVSTGSVALSQARGDANRRVVQHCSFNLFNSSLPLTIFNLHATLDDGSGYDTNLQEVLVR